MAMETMQSGGRATSDAGGPQFNVRCRTCKVSRVFLTPQGVNAFILEHAGHEVVDSRFDTVSSVVSEEILRGESKPRQEEGPVLASEVVLEPRFEDQGSKQIDEPRPEPDTAEPAVAPQPELPVLVQAEAPPEERRPVLLSEEEKREPLLLARSSYVEDSEERRAEALKVSRALKEFRWNVEPPYVIGVMVDDNLSIETNIGVISSSVVKRVEELGYAFVAINVPQKSPIAWFKKSGGELGMLAPSLDAERTMNIEQRKRTYDKDKAVWEESFLSLLMTVKDMDSERLKDVANTIRSAVRAEPDLQL